MIPLPLGILVCMPPAPSACDLALLDHLVRDVYARPPLVIEPPPRMIPLVEPEAPGGFDEAIVYQPNAVFWDAALQAGLVAEAKAFQGSYPPNRRARRQRG